jgi:hypothetical protein
VEGSSTDTVPSKPLPYHLEEPLPTVRMSDHRGREHPQLGEHRMDGIQFRLARENRKVHVMLGRNAAGRLFSATSSLQKRTLPEWVMPSP